MSMNFYLYCSVSMAFIRFITVLFNIEMFYLVLICSVRFRCVLFGFHLYCSTLICSIWFWLLLIGYDKFYLAMIHSVLNRCFTPFLSVLFDIDLFHLVSITTIRFLLSQRESLVTVKIFDPQISMIFDISDLPESKYAFSRKCLCVCMYVCVLFGVDAIY